MQVFVAGSTGATGRQVVTALRAKGISVIAGVRVRSDTSAFFSKLIYLFFGYFDPLNIFLDNINK